MSENSINLRKLESLVDKQSLIFLGIICLSGLVIRFYYFPFDIPITLDGLGYFWYAIEIKEQMGFPETLQFPNNGWSTFLSIFYIVIPSGNFLDYMTIQKVVSVSVSVITIPIIYFLSRRFFSKSLAMISAVFFCFDPRIILNSLLGSTETLYIFLGTLTLFLFLSKRYSLICISFLIAGLMVLVRYEGVVILIPLTIMFFVKFRKKDKVILRYILLIGIFILILLPMVYIRTQTIESIRLQEGDLIGEEKFEDYKGEKFSLISTGYDGIISHSIMSPTSFYGEVLKGEDGFNDLLHIFEKGIKNLIQYFTWITIPIFIIFLPLGFYLFIKNRNHDKITIIIFLIVMCIPAFYAYSRGMQDTRYLLIMIPILSIFAASTIQKINEKINRPKILGLIIIVFLLSTSGLFLYNKQIDRDYERDSYLMSIKISDVALGVNDYYPEARYLDVSQFYKYEFPIKKKLIEFVGSRTFSMENYESLEEFILYYEDKGLTHIIFVNNETKLISLNDIESNAPFLKKEFESRDFNYKPNIAVYKIDYKIFKEMI